MPALKLLFNDLVGDGPQVNRAVGRPNAHDEVVIWGPQHTFYLLVEVELCLVLQLLCFVNLKDILSFSIHLRRRRFRT